MAKNFYAIRKGFNTEKNEVVENVILTSWKEASKYVQGITKAKHGVSPEYQGFMKLTEAEDYINSQDPLMRKEEEKYPKDCLHCYVDGSFKDQAGNYSYGLVCIKDNKVLHIDKGVGSNKEAISMRQVGGELLGAMKALIYARNNNHKKVVIFHDYKGVCYHAIGYWKRDTIFSEQYYNWVQKFMNSNPDIEVVFCKVDAHTKDDFNEVADGLAKLAISIEPDKIFFDMIYKHKISI